MQDQDYDNHDGTSDATPGGYPDRRRPGELAFAGVLLAASLYLLYSAYGIAGFEALSSPGAVPMATTVVMVISALVVVVRTARLHTFAKETISGSILPRIVIIFTGLLIAYGVLLKPLGFLPTSALFLVASIRLLSDRSWGFVFAVSAGSLLCIWLIFRIVFTVLMPVGIVPEAEIIQFFRAFVHNGAA
ncbi:tripartite tricarboxylate transporter TctB family protein [Roseibium suaedae]|uniref:Tripartite tricarboxylate transporter TctB family protein n=1 Tax=Roseibium suaedae TaxID=735517 RepID=A0A1M7KP93_9HYPH|nr:tripartite tricarboxylate transporter TctB family protein [Roseibium suaedae]SHM67250.1 Tripartite tricarboxylate transporter TctB family protein [Roseibium suaedae]